MTTKKSIVSGGTGYVGRFIVEDLLAAGHEVTVLGRSAPADGFFYKPVRFASLTLEPDAVSREPFEDADFFIHAAFDHLPGKYRGGEGDDPVGFCRRNLDGTVALFEAAKAGSVKRTAFLSSRAVYGPRPPGTWLHEDDEAQPDTLYGEVKLKAEQALTAMSDHSFLGVSLRVTGVYGPAGPGTVHKWAGLFADYLAGHEIAPRAGTEVHGQDVAAAVRLALESGRLPESVFNVSDVLMDRRDILAMVKRITGSPRALPKASDKEAVNTMRTDRLRALGWQPGGLERLEDTISSLLSRH